MVDIPLFDGPSFREIVLMVGFIVGIAITLALTLATLIGCCVWRCCVCCQRRRRKKEVLQQRVLDASGGPSPSGGASEQRVYHPVGADMRARALLDIEEEERGQKVSRVTWVLVYVVVWTWLFFLGAGPLFWLVVMDYLPWWAGWLCATALLWLGWFFFFPFYGHRHHHHDAVRLDRRSSLRDSGYVLVEDDDGYGDTRMLSINPATAQRADFHGNNGTGGGDGAPRTTRRGSRNPIKLTGRLLRERVRRVRRRPFVFVGGLLFWLVLIFSLTFVFEGMCIGEYPISSTSSLSSTTPHGSC